MARYTKHTSNYINRGKHQNLKGGFTIFERDWVTTTGNRLRFGPDKVAMYSDGNFVFTTSFIPNYRKKHKLTTEVGVWKYDQVKDAVPDINYINVEENADSLRRFAYYGSAVELVRVSLEDIIQTFPACVWSEEVEDFAYKIIRNPFAVNFKDPFVPERDNNINRFMYTSFDEYLVNGNDITEYIVITRKLYQNVQTKEFNYFSDEEYEEVDHTLWKPSNCKITDYRPGDRNPIYEVIISTSDSKAYVLESFVFDNEVVLLTQGDDFFIEPIKEEVELYFRSIKGFEKLLLNRKSTPAYTCSLVTPFVREENIFYYHRTYTWPSKISEYSNIPYILINTVEYTDYVKRLTDMAYIYDEVWCNNLYSRMTHEAITNYDWTYTRSYTDGDEEDNVAGGEKMKKTLMYIGRVFDDVKRYIDKIKDNNKNTYSNYNNSPNALISDNLDIMGWDVCSTIPTFNIDSEDVDMHDVTIENLPEECKWYTNQNVTKYSAVDNDINFMRRLLLNTRRIMQSKGTRESIDMVMGMFGYGDEDYDVSYELRRVTPVNYDAEIEPNLAFGDAIVDVNENKDMERIYANDETSGIPVGSFVESEFVKNEQSGEYENKTNVYVIPYFDNDKLYDGNIAFQSKGGWAAKIAKDTKQINKIDWTETMSYLRVSQNLTGLTNVSPRSVEEGDIYFVYDISDYATIYNQGSTPIELVSNYFVLDNGDSDTFADPNDQSSWRTVIMVEYYQNNTDGRIITVEQYEQLDPSEQGNYSLTVDPYYEQALYLDNILSINTGNNPHCGYGLYDKGEEFFEYMKEPFKYAIDNSLITNNRTELARQITFDVSDPLVYKLKDSETANNILKQALTQNEYDSFASEYCILRDPSIESESDHYIVPRTSMPMITKYMLIKDKYEPITDKSIRNNFDNETHFYTKTSTGECITDKLYNENPERYDRQGYVEIPNEETAPYMLNSKVVRITNKLQSESEGENRFNQYFAQVIFKYLTQVIPSSTILILENF